VNDLLLPLLLLSPYGNPRLVIVSSELGNRAHSLCPKDIRDQIEKVDTLTWDELAVIANQYLDSNKKEEKKEVKDMWPDPKPIYGPYGVSKMLLSVYGRILARELKAKNVTVAIVCPGYCATELNGFRGPRSVQVGAKSILYGITIPLSETGNFFQDGKLFPPSYMPPQEA